MRQFIFILALLFIFSSSSYAYSNMSKVNQRAKQLNMNTKDYTFSMAISGALSGMMFGLFLWKIK